MKNLKQNTAGIQNMPFYNIYKSGWSQKGITTSDCCPQPGQESKLIIYIYMYICLTDPEVQLFEQLAHVEHHVPLVQRFNDKKGKQQRYEKNFSNC
jgi:hypothetical protein